MPTATTARSIASVALFTLVACVGDAPVTLAPDSGVDGNVTADGAVPDGGADGGSDAAVDSGPPPATGKPLWVKTFGGGDIAGVATDASGNTYATGTYRGAQVDFGSGKKLSSSKSADTFVVKLDPAGNTLWATSVGGTGGPLNVNDENATDISVDPSGDVYVSGNSDSGTITAGTTATSTSQLNGFVFKLGGSDGSAKWVVMVSSVSSGISNACRGVAASATVVAVGCTFDGNTVDWTGGGPLSNQDNPSNFAADLVVIGLDPVTHATKWGNVIGEKGTSDGLSSLAVDGSGDVLVSGGFSGPTVATSIVDSLSSISIPRPIGTTRDAFFARLSAANGKQVWSKLYAGTKNTVASSMASDPKSSLVMLGGNFASVDLGKGTVTAAGTNDAFAIGFDSTSKSALFAKSIGGGANGQFSVENTTGLAVDAWGEAIAVGTHQSTDSAADGKPILGPPTINVSASFVVKYAPAGTVMWARGIASGNAADEVVATSVGVVPNGELRVGGHWKGTAALDGTTPATAAVGGQAFLIALSP